MIPQIITYERQARNALLSESRQALQDQVSRAYGTLCSATMMTSEETMDLLSSVRLGVNLGLLDDITIADGQRAVHPHAAGAPAEADGHPARRRGAQRRARSLPADAAARGGCPSQLNDHAAKPRT